MARKLMPTSAVAEAFLGHAKVLLQRVINTYPGTGVVKRNYSVEDGVYILITVSEIEQRAIIVAGTRGFAPKPRTEISDYLLLDDKRIVILESDGTAWSTDPSYPIDPEWESAYLCGNVDWTGENTSDDEDYNSAEVLSFKGPAGRLIPIDREQYYPSYNVTDEEFLTTTTYTCFEHKIYQDGTALYELPQIGNTTTKVTGVASIEGRTVCIANVNYRDIANPDSTDANPQTGGYFEFLLVQDTIREATEANPLTLFEQAGWLQVWVRRTGAPTEIWRFDSTGLNAVKGLETLVITMTESDGSRSYSAAIEDIPLTYGVGDEQYPLDGSKTYWRLNESGEFEDFRDYLLEEAKKFTITHNVNEDASRSVTYDNTVIDAPVGRAGEETDGVFASCSISPNITGDPADSSYYLAGNQWYHADITWQVEPVSCEPNITYSWAYSPPTTDDNCVGGADVVDGSLTVTISSGDTTCSHTEVLAASVSAGNYHWHLSSTVTHSWPPGCSGGAGCGGTGPTGYIKLSESNTVKVCGFYQCLNTGFSCCTEGLVRSFTSCTFGVAYFTSIYTYTKVCGSCTDHGCTCTVNC